eukprot:3039885-Rhodomonas_salina.1
MSLVSPPDSPSTDITGNGQFPWNWHLIDNSDIEAEAKAKAAAEAEEKARQVPAPGVPVDHTVRPNTEPSSQGTDG